jgi:hypothetical protein
MRAPLSFLVVLGLIAPASAKGHSGCHSKSCKVRVEKRAAHAKWRPIVHAYGIGLLRARMQCESGNHGGYALATTGNTYWFAHQFNVGAWTGAGGRMRKGRPAGVWAMQPSRLEQDFRAVRWDAIHGGDPWPRCP